MEFVISCLFLIPSAEKITHVANITLNVFHTTNQYVHVYGRYVDAYSRYVDAVDMLHMQSTC